LERSGLRQRAWEAIVSVVFSRFVRIAEQFILVPICLSVWGVAAYGEWLTLTAMTAFLSFSDFGFGQTAAGEIVMGIANNDRERAQKAFASYTFMLTVIALIIVAILIAISLRIDISALAGFTRLGSHEAGIIASCTGITMILTFYRTPLSAVLGATIGAGRANLLPALFKIAEVTLVAVAVFRGGTPAVASGLMLVAGILTVVGYFIVIPRVAPWFKVLSIVPDREVLFRMLKPSLGNLTLFFSVNMIGTQLPRIILFSALGSSAVAVFSVTATYARTIRTLSGIVSYALQIEVGHAYGAGDSPRFVNLVSKMCRVSVWSAVVLGSGAFIFAFLFIPLWTNGRMSVDVILLICLIIESVIASLSDSILYALTVINKVAASAGIHLSTLLLGLAVSSMFLSRFGPAAIAFGLIAPDIAVILFGWRGVELKRGEDEAIRLSQLIKWPGDLLKNEFNALLRSSVWAKVVGR
jgi:O-antigen/teichoic acid export membrane protein